MAANRSGGLIASVRALRTRSRTSIRSGNGEIGREDMNRVYHGDAERRLAFSSYRTARSAAIHLLLHHGPGDHRGVARGHTREIAETL